MGTWSTAIFGDDVAADVREGYLAALADGATDEEALAEMIEDWAGADDDPDEGPVFWLALAATQWEFGRLGDAVRDKAIEVIDGGADAARWDGSKDARRRAGVLARLRAKLLSPQPRRRTPRQVALPDVPGHTVASPDGRATASVSELHATSAPDVPMCQLAVSIRAKGAEGGGGLGVARCAWQAVDLRWADADTLEVTLPARTDRQGLRDSMFFYGRTVTVRYL